MRIQTILILVRRQSLFWKYEASSPHDPAQALRVGSHHGAHHLRLLRPSRDAQLFLQSMDSYRLRGSGGRRLAFPVAGTQL